jgi:thymidine kinase
MGTLELIIGPMFSGKTKLLISRYKEIINNTSNTNILVINYYKDTRYGTDSIISHDGEIIPAINISLLSIVNNLIEISNFTETNNFNYIFINEGQFFPDLKESVITLIERYNKHVVICGLDCDYKQEKFGQIWDLIPHANTIIKLQGKCNNCSNKSLFTHRLTNEVSQELIGTHNYIPLCRTCYNSSNSYKT